MATSAITPTPTPRTPAQLRAEAARALYPTVHLGGLLVFPVFVLALLVLPSSGAALGVLAALALAFLGGVLYGARMRRLRADHGPDHGSDHGPADSPTARLVTVLDNDVTRAELPQGPARLALARAIVAGEIDALYRPFGAPAHNVCLAGLPADVDPRITVAEWVTRWHAGGHPAEQIISEYHARQARTVAQTEGGR